MQIPDWNFDGKGVVMEELQNEPSSSEVEIDLDMGSLVVKTKKLNKSSSFDIESPVGTAGIRGTEFQLGYDASSGVELRRYGINCCLCSQGRATSIDQSGKRSFRFDNRSGR